MRLLIPILCSLLLFSCGNKRRHVSRGFYYWKTSFELSPYESSRLKSLGASRLYLRSFDVDMIGSSPTPVGVIRKLEGRAGIQIVPVVFITQDAVLPLAREAEVYGARISTLLQSLFAALPSPDEVQIDCDWTAGNKEAYFRLLSALRKQPFFQNKKLSCTIRLHQLKYRLQSGIPPVDRGLLMCYNMGNLRAPGPGNSILDEKLARQYLRDGGTYPLQLDVALPLFRWSLLFRDGKLKGILRDITPEEVATASHFKAESSSVYTATADTVWKGYSFRRGDVVRTESVSPDALMSLAELTARQVKTDSLRVLLFHADSLTLAKYSNDDLEAVYRSFH